MGDKDLKKKRSGSGRRYEWRDNPKGEGVIYSDSAYAGVVVAGIRTIWTPQGFRSQWWAKGCYQNKNVVHRGSEARVADAKKMAERVVFHGRTTF